MSEPHAQFIYKTYEEGKARRYGLMFSVNGGAFAILSLWVQNCKTAGQDAVPATTVIFGDLMLWHIAVGLAAFSALMALDMWKFGAGRARELDELGELGGETRIFQPVGKAVLVLVSALLVLGWLAGGGVGSAIAQLCRVS